MGYVSRYRNIEDRRETYEREHPREAAIMRKIARCKLKLSQWGYHITWTDRICANTGRGVNERYAECVRNLAKVERMKGAWELRLEEVRA